MKVLEPVKLTVGLALGLEEGDLIGLGVIGLGVGSSVSIVGSSVFGLFVGFLDGFLVGRSVVGTPVGAMG